MATTKEAIQDGYPLPAYNYRVSIADNGDAPTMSFSEVSGLSQEYEAVTYKHGLSYVMGHTIVPGMRQPVRITLKRGIFKASSYFSDWLDATYRESFSDKVKRDITISLCNEAAEPLVSWHVKSAMPLKLEAPNFDPNSNDVAIESMELIAHSLSVSYN
ncbi:MAG: phage tail protein [Alteromonadaceae bacterium]|nr:MAG: phage tail protein [Alteromonadaceae bacterium]